MTVVPFYSDSRATLYRGDALAVLAQLPDDAVDAVITDPPYSSGGMVRGDRMMPVHAKYVSSQQNKLGTGGGGLDEFSGDNRDQRAYAYWSALWMGEALRLTRPAGILLCFTDWRQLPSTVDAVQAGGWVWRGIVPWIKPTARPQSGRFTAQAEYVVWASSGRMPVDFTDATLPGFYQISPPREREHITQKPVALMRSLLAIASTAGHVLDPFMGAGSTGVAAVADGRRFTGIEILESHALVAARRIREAADVSLSLSSQAALPFDVIP